MKISLLFLVLVTVIQLCTSNVLSKRGVQEELLSSGENGIQNGSDVIMLNPGPLNVILQDGNELVFEVCSTVWTADFLVCYEADSAGQNVLQQCHTNCGFYVTTLGHKISFMNVISSDDPGVNKLGRCFQVNMKNGRSGVLANEQTVGHTVTCKPKIENGIVKLTIMNATDECPVSVKNAIIKPDPTTAAPTTPGRLTLTSTTRGNGSATMDDESDSFIGNYWWIFLIIGILIVGAIIGIGVYCCIRRRKSKKTKKTVALPRKIQHSKSPVVLQLSTEPAQNRSEATPASVFQQSSILSHKSLMWSKKENDGNKSAGETDLTSMKPTA